MFPKFRRDEILSKIDTPEIKKTIEQIKETKQKLDACGLLEFTQKSKLKSKLEQLKADLREQVAICQK